jgi:serine/threonine-protein kinase
MSVPRWQKVEEVFHEAAELPADRRAAFLDRACAGDAALREEVEALLRSFDDAEGFLETPVITQGADLLSSACEPSLAGEILGPYRVIREIGRGGMGTVYLAERADDQFHKTVAIKLIGPGMTDPGAVERFQRERQILANLEHSNITRLLDGGMTSQGQPFIVMDYVEGMPIDLYCDSNRLSTEQRLALFLEVCSAVQYAHQNLVVHRDIKHGNVLVTPEGVPKLVDFGIAKLLEADPSMTRAAQLGSTGLMTPDYASPEQVRGEPITTATDVYSLGVLLYRLLTGRHPYRLTDSNPAELVAVICEQEPERPSRVEGYPERLRRRLAGDLDNVIMMALRKEPGRRYTSVEQFAADIRRHLDGQPVLARSSTLGYRARKFLRRHRLGVAAVALVALTLVAGIVATAMQAHIASRERDRSRQEAEKAQRVTEFLQGMLSSADPYSGGRSHNVAEVLDHAAARVQAELGEQPEIEAAVRTSLGMTYLNLGVYDDADKQLRRALEVRRALHGQDHIDVATSMQNLSILLAAKGDLRGAEPLCRQALEIARRTSGEESLEVASILNTLGGLLLREGDLPGAEAANRESLEIRSGLLGEGHPDVAESLNDLAVVLGTKGDHRQAEALHRQALEITRKVRGPEHPEVAVALSNLAGMKEAQQDHAAAESLYRQALDLRRKVLGPDHPDVAWTLANFAYLMFEKGDHAEAAKLSREVLGMRGRVLPEEHPTVAGALLVLGRSLVQLGDPGAALSPLRECLELRQRALPADHWLIANTESVLGECLARMERYAEAERLLLDSAARLEAALGPDHERTREARDRLVLLQPTREQR